MEPKKVRDVMVPLSGYATVSQDATLFDAVQALEEAQKKFDPSRYKHRAILVLDAAGKVVGKLSQNDVLRSLEPKYEALENIGRVSHWELSPSFIKSMMKDYGLWEKPLDDICRKAAQRRIKEIMYTPAQGEYVEESANLNEAIHQLVIGHHQSLIVTSQGGKEVVGILKLTDVFSEVCDLIKVCEI